MAPCEDVSERFIFSSDSDKFQISRYSSILLSITMSWICRLTSALLIVTKQLYVKEVSSFALEVNLSQTCKSVMTHAFATMYLHLHVRHSFKLYGKVGI